jgi:hypothetical protein
MITTRHQFCRVCTCAWESEDAGKIEKNSSATVKSSLRHHHILDINAECNAWPSLAAEFTHRFSRCTYYDVRSEERLDKIARKAL